MLVENRNNDAVSSRYLIMNATVGVNFFGFYTNSNSCPSVIQTQLMPDFHFLALRRLACELGGQMRNTHDVASFHQI